MNYLGEALWGGGKPPLNALKWHACEHNSEASFLTGHHAHRQLRAHWPARLAGRYYKNKYGTKSADVIRDARSWGARVMACMAARGVAGVGRLTLNREEGKSLLSTITI